MFKHFRHTLQPEPLSLPVSSGWSWPAARYVLGSFMLVLAFTACASAPVPPSRELQAAQTAIDSAEQANSEVTGRQMNHRVEIIIINIVTEQN